MMNTPLVPVVLGLLLVGLGLSNVKGNLSSIHWYHRQRVTEENRPAFGKLVGCGTILIGASLAAFGLFTFLAEKMQNDLLTICGLAILIVAVITGLAVSLYAMFKYNRGIF